MKENKLTPEEIKKALECCKPGNDEGCLNCPLANVSLPECAEILSKEALNLINRQQAEIERLQSKIKTNEGLVLEIFENKRTWERLARIKAIKEFAERLKEEYFTERFCGQKYDLIHDWIDNLVKEMVGEE